MSRSATSEPRLAIVGDSSVDGWENFLSQVQSRVSLAANSALLLSATNLDSPATSPGLIELGGPLHLRRPYRILERLRKEDLYEVHCWEQLGVGYYALLAKRLGLAFSTTKFVVHIVGPILYQREQAGEFPQGVDEVEIDFMERRSVEWADEVVCEDPLVRRWIMEQNWRCAQPPTLKERLHSPLVSICMVHRDRPALLEQAITSLEAQDYSAFELILVDDGSATDEARRLLDAYDERFRERGWTLIRQSNRYLGAARNEAARRAKGEYLLFMDDDNVAKPHELSTLVACAQRSNADLLTPLADFFTGEAAPATETSILCRWLYSAAGPVVGMARNCFGDANALVRRDCFEALGGFTEDVGVGHEDWEFFVQAALAGYSHFVVPEPLFWYRASLDGMLRGTDAFANLRRHLRPYASTLPPWAAALPLAVQGYEQHKDAQLEVVADRERQITALKEEIGRRDFHLTQLRYRLVDRCNAWFQKLPTMHRWFKRLLGG